MSIDVRWTVRAREKLLRTGLVVLAGLYLDLGQCVDDHIARKDAVQSAKPHHLALMLVEGNLENRQMDERGYKLINAKKGKHGPASWKLGLELISIHLF